MIFRSLSGDRYYFHGELQSSDGAPGPVKLLDINIESCDDKFFLFYIADCFSPPMYLVQASSEAEAYEEFCDWQTDQLKIDESGMPSDEAEKQDYLETCNYNSKGVAIDSEGIHFEEVKLLMVLHKSSDRHLWNLACMFLSQVTRYENEYDDTAKFRKALAICCTPSNIPDRHKAESVVRAWREARNLSNYTF